MPHRVMTLQQVAEYIHLPKADVEDLVHRRRIPFEKSGNRLVFRRVEIDAWASRLLLDGGGANLGEFHQRASEQAYAISQDHQILPCLLTADRIEPDLRARTRTSAISEMVMLAGETGLVNDPVDLLESLRQREELCSTALPGGIALLHPRHHHEYLFEESFVVLGRALHPVPFGSPDGKMTDLFFLICCGDDRLHLHTIARLCAMCAKTELTAQLRAGRSAQDLFDAINAAELAVIGSLKK